jgi:UPF0271 protein
MPAIDLNADLGESFGRWTIGGDEALLDLVTSASIACGFHAGDPQVMVATAAAAAARGVSVGAHPGYPDLVGFGRRDLAATPDQIRCDVLYQIGALHACCHAAGTGVRYVKPHGALYNRAARDVAAANAIAAAVADADPTLVLLGLAGSALVSAGRRAGLRVAEEAFVDRNYEPDGTLTPRSHPDAVLTDPEFCARRAVRLVQEGIVATRDGSELRVTAESLCVHGDGRTAIALLQQVREALTSAGVVLRPFA